MDLFLWVLLGVTVIVLPLALWLDIRYAHRVLGKSWWDVFGPWL